LKASIIYNSHSGTTKGFAETIGEYLGENNIENSVGSIDSYDRDFLRSADLVLLGCWTSGLMIIAQHPDRPWKHFAARLPSIEGKQVALFTTYKIATGSMFRKMEKTLKGKIDKPMALIKAKGRDLTEAHRETLRELFLLT
jgi:flavodoxin